MGQVFLLMIILSIPNDYNTKNGSMEIRDIKMAY